ncbi:MAG: dolichyl-phosphate-mannose--protein mannosyltransferase [Micrococcales bacterium]
MIVARTTALVRDLVRSYGQYLVVALAAFLRLFSLQYPGNLVFDETYYVKDAWTLTNLGYEASWKDGADDAWSRGQVNGFNTSASFVVHPPLGKLIIGLGLHLFGPDHPVSWRIMNALFGVAAVWLVMQVAYKLLGSRSWALVAGFLFAIDGVAIVMSRVALLDGFLMFFALLAFYFLLLDRERARVKYTLMALRQASQKQAIDDWRSGSVIWARPWLVAAAAALGLATAVKWSGIYFALIFGLYVVVSETLLRRRYKIRGWLYVGLVYQTLANLVLMVPVYAAVYLSTWVGWLSTKGGWDRNVDPNPLLALLRYHQDAYNFHVNLRTPHTYQANPLTWLFQIRPTSMFYQSRLNGEAGCVSVANGCSSAITAIGNPLIWVGAAAALFYLLYHYLRFRNRTEGLILLGVAAGYLPWLLYLQRTVFQFYVIAFEPWLILALVYVLRSVWYRPKRGGFQNPRWHVVTFLVASAVLSIFYLSVWWGTWTPYPYWLSHMWLPSWI